MQFLHKKKKKKDNETKILQLWSTESRTDIVLQNNSVCLADSSFFSGG